MIVVVDGASSTVVQELFRALVRDTTDRRYRCGNPPL